MGNGRLKKGKEDFSYKLPAVPGFIQGVPSACDLPGGSGLPTHTHTHTHTHPAHRLGVSHSHKVTEWPIAPSARVWRVRVPGFGKPGSAARGTDCRVREPRASGLSRRHPRRRGLLLEEMWREGGGCPRLGITLRGRPQRGRAPPGAGRGRSCAGLGLALPQTRG